MDRWIRPAWAILVVGLILLASSFIGRGQPLVAEFEAEFTTEEQVVGTVAMPGRENTIWLEDHPAWTDDLDDILLMVERDIERGTSTVGVGADGWTFRDIEGVRCFLLRTVYRPLESTWDIKLTIRDMNEIGNGTVRVFVLRSPSSLVVAGIGFGSIMTVIGASIVVWRRWPKE